MDSENDEIKLLLQTLSEWNNDKTALIGVNWYDLLNNSIAEEAKARAATCFK